MSNQVYPPPGLPVSPTARILLPKPLGQSTSPPTLQATPYSSSSNLQATPAPEHILPPNHVNQNGQLIHPVTERQLHTGPNPYQSQPQPRDPLPEWAIGQDFIAYPENMYADAHTTQSRVPGTPTIGKQTFPGQEESLVSRSLPSAGPLLQHEDPRNRPSFQPGDRQDNDDSSQESESDSGLDGSSSEDSDDSDDDQDDQFTSAKLQESVLAPVLAPSRNDALLDLGLGFNIPILDDFEPKGPRRKKGKQGGSKPTGPRKAVEPTGDIKLRLSTANEAFMEEDYEKAIKIISEIIRINAETYEAWMMLSSAWQELGDVKKAIKAQLGGIQLRPKHPEGWLAVARRFEEDGDFRGADHCYRYALRFVPGYPDAHLGKARINVIKRNFKGAISEFNKVLTHKPHDLEVIRGLTETYYFVKKYEEAKQLMKKTFLHYKEPDNYGDEMPDWNDLVSYISYYEALGDYSGAINELNSQARWLLGRESQDFFDGVPNDCEWDKDDQRRAEIPGFNRDEFESSVYGEGLPMNLRVQLGICRYKIGHREEALRHFEWLDVMNTTGLNKVFEYRDSYLEIADLLFADASYQRAVTFYGALRKIPDEETPYLYIRMGRCCRANNINFKAEDFFLKALELDQDNIEARIELGELYLHLNQKAKAARYIEEAKRLKNGPPKPPRIRRRGMRRELQRSSPAAEPEPVFKKTPKRQYFRSQPKPKKHWLQDSELGSDDVTATQEAKRLYSTFLYYRQGTRDGNYEAIVKWLEAVQMLTNDFRAIRNFYPFHKPKEFPEGADFSHSMAEKMNQHGLPTDFRGITFNEWLDVFLEYALFLARNGDRDESYQICEAIKDSTVFSRSREDMFLVHVVWCTCALYAADEQACYFVSKSFMKHYQFTTDSYRMYAAVSKMCHSPLSWYMGGPIKKYIHRQIIQMDAMIKETERPDGIYDDETLDISLLMLYGHIMYSSASYDLALDYFFRAYALEQTPMIDLSISLTYIHLLLNRRSDDHAQLLLLGLTFLFRYYDVRKTSIYAEERQESHFNVARTYHMLGLSSHASRYYTLVLNEASNSDHELLREDLTTDAAYNLQTIYAMVGNVELAKAVTDRWLVL